MLGHSSRFQTYVKKIAPDCTFMHSMILHEAMASKTLGSELKKVVKHLIKLINTVRFCTLNTRLFSCFCENMESDHYNLLYHTEVRWLSKTYLLQRICTLRIELKKFFILQNEEKLVKFVQEDVVSLAYLVDIFDRLNE